MSQEQILRWSSAGFAVLWTAGMFVVSDERGVGPLVILCVAGAAAGFGWYWAMRLMQRVLKARAR